MSKSKIKHIAKIITEKSDLPNEVLSLDKLESFTGKILDKENDFSGDSFSGRKGDVVFAKIRPYLAKVAHLDKDMNVFTTLMLIRPNESIDGKFVFWYMINQPFIDEANSLASGVTMPTIGWEELKNIEVRLPEFTTQQRIAAFLDSQTGKIDNLVDELTKFKGQLQTQRKSLISECVTKGVPEDRDRAYKDSGVEWLGEIPVGWESNKIGRIAKFFTGATPPTGDADSYDGDKMWANISDVGSHYIYETSKTISEDAARKANIIESPINSLLFSFKLSLGKVSIVKQPMYSNEAIATFLENDDIAINWAYYAFPVYIPENSKINIYGSPLLNADLIKSAKIAVPPLDEQQRIAAYLDTETAKIDALIGEIDNQVNLLKTYRKSLINKVVTGKVEV